MSEFCLRLPHIGMNGESFQEVSIPVPLEEGLRKAFFSGSFTDGVRSNAGESAPPLYFEAEKRFREAKTPEDKVEALEEMWQPGLREQAPAVPAEPARVALVK